MPFWRGRSRVPRRQGKITSLLLGENDRTWDKVAAAFVQVGHLIKMAEDVRENNNITNIELDGVVAVKERIERAFELLYNFAYDTPLRQTEG